MTSPASKLESVAATPEGPILWAVNPAETDLKPDLAAVETLSRCASGDCGPVTPVYVVSASADAEAAKREAAAYLKGVANGSVDHIETLVAAADSRREAAARLVREAVDRRAPLIAVSSHGRWGLAHWLLGSFAEKLLETAPVPILFLSHRQGAVALPEPCVLFAADFSPRSRRAFEQLLGLARRAGLRVILYYEAAIPVVAAGDAGLIGAPAVMPAHYLDDRRDWAKDQSGRWVTETARFGVPIEAVIQVGGIHVATGILQAAAKYRAAMIAMASSSTPFTRVILGNIAREVFRQNTCPVWMYGPGAGCDAALHS